MAAFEKGKATFGRIDYGASLCLRPTKLVYESRLLLETVFANAGIAELPWLPAFDPATAANRPISKPNFATLSIDCIGQLNTAALALQYFERQEKGANGFRGKLVLTASVIGFYPSTTMPMYSAAKAAIVNFMRSSAAFYADKDVTINCSKS